MSRRRWQTPLVRCWQHLQVLADQRLAPPPCFQAPRSPRLQELRHSFIFLHLIAGRCCLCGRGRPGGGEMEADDAAPSTAASAGSSGSTLTSVSSSSGSSLGSAGLSSCSGSDAPSAAPSSDCLCQRDLGVQARHVRSKPSNLWWQQRLHAVPVCVHHKRCIRGQARTHPRQFCLTVPELGLFSWRCQHPGLRSLQQPCSVAQARFRRRRCWCQAAAVLSEK